MPLSAAISIEQLETAETAYADEGVFGSDEKTVRGAEIFKVNGAEVNAGPAARAAGVVTVAAPVGKRMALAALTLKTVELPVVSCGLPARLAGNWISVLMFRRCLTCILSKIFPFANKSAEQADDVVRLPRDIAEELHVSVQHSQTCCRL